MFVFLSECTSYKTINDPTRCVSNQIESKNALCDRGILTSESWVRFTGCGGTAIPNNPPQAYHCGTNAPGWIRGAHPAVAEGVVKRKLCYRFNDNECHYGSYKISIRNCGSFFVYKPPDLTHCYLRLCTGVYLFDQSRHCFLRLHNNIIISANMACKLAYVPENHITKSKGKENRRGRKYKFFYLSKRNMDERQSRERSKNENKRLK